TLQITFFESCQSFWRPMTMSKAFKPAGPGKARQRRRPNPAQCIAAVLSVAIIVSGCGRGSDSAKGGKKGRGPGGSNAPVAAIIGDVMQKDVPIYLDGLGTVQAFNTVTVRSRVDGELKKLSFKEGQDVQAGQLLAQIDPDPFRTQVEQLEAKKAQ